MIKFFIKLTLFVVLVGVPALIGFAWYKMKGKEVRIKISEETVQKKLDEKLPYTKNYFLALDITMNQVKLDFVKETNRVKVDAVVQLKIKLVDSILDGTISANTDFKFDTETKSFILVDPAVEQINIEGVPVLFHKKVSEAVNLLFADYISSNAVYKLPSEDTKQFLTKSIVKDVYIEGDDVVIVFGY